MNDTQICPTCRDWRQITIDHRDSGKVPHCAGCLRPPDECPCRVRGEIYKDGPMPDVPWRWGDAPDEPITVTVSIQGTVVAEYEAKITKE